MPAQAAPTATGVRATTLTPLHYHSLPVQSGTATIARFLADRAMSYALAGAMGALAASPALPRKDYLRDLKALPWLCSMFESPEAELMRPLAKRNNLDAEGGFQKRIQEATSTGNLKTWFFIQEIPPRTVYHGAVFGPNPFRLASEAIGETVDALTVRVGRHLGGVVRLERAEAPTVRLNAWTAHLFGAAPDNPRLTVDAYALYDMQATAPLPLGEAAEEVGAWRRFAA